MAELDERLRRLISDNDSMKQVLELASAVMSGQSSRSSTDTPKSNNSDSGPDLSSVLHSLTDSDPQRTKSSDTSSVSALLGIMPQLLQALSGDTSLLQNDRVNLVRAVQPYLPQDKAENIDRAMRMANLTKLAKDVLKLLGR